MSVITIDYNSWLLLKERLSSDQPKSVMIIREKMRNVLGFTTRVERRNSKKVMHLDFFDDLKKTMFVLKYSGYLKNDCC